MEEALFSKLITCADCGKTHKSKLARGKRIYTCSTYDNKGKSYCSRNKIDQSYLLELLQMRYKYISSPEELAAKAVSITANSDKITINVSDDANPIISTDRYLQL